MNVYNRCATQLFACALAVFSSLAIAGEPVAAPDGVAIGGHDTVAYHSLKSDTPASKGIEEFIVSYKGADWRFLDKTSAEKFAADPEKYSPAYNGHCANALSIGNGLVPTDGTHWQIFGDQLYLFFAARGRTRWLDGNWQNYKADADAAWQQLK